VRARTRRLRRLSRRWGPLYPYMVGRVSFEYVRDNCILLYWPIHHLSIDQRYPHATPTRIQARALRKS
jgi:hypothetical protein